MGRKQRRAGSVGIKDVEQTFELSALLRMGHPPGLFHKSAEPRELLIGDPLQKMDEVVKVSGSFHPDEGVASFQDFGDPEIQEFDGVFLFCDVDIPAADIIMEKSVEVDVVQGGEKLSHDTEEFFLFAYTADSFEELPSFDEIHGKEIILRGDQVSVNGPDGTEIMNAHNMRVTKRPQDLKLLFEVFQAGRLGHVEINDLDDDIHRKSEVPGFVDDPHGPFSDLGDDRIPVIDELHIL